MKQYAYWFLEFLILFVILVFVGVALSGCAIAVPYDACVDTICEQKAIKREDIHFKRDQLELKRLACTVPYMWDGASRKCRSIDMWIS